MSGNNIIGNRNSTPEASSSSLRPPSSRTMGAGHHLRASADMGAFTSSPLSGRTIRPASEMIYNQSQPYDEAEKTAEQYLAEIDQCETTLEEMAGATTDQDFKDELTAIEQWFRVLSEAERTASLYSLLQQATKVQIMFFIQTLKEMLEKHPMPGILSPAKTGDQDGMSNRMSEVMSKDTARHSLGRPLPSPSNKRNSGLDPSTISAMFPDAAAAIARKKDEYAQATGNAPASNRNSAAFGDRSSLLAPTISEPRGNTKENAVQPSATPWGQRAAENRPKSSSGQQPMGQFSQPPASAGLRSPRPLQLSGQSNVQSTTLNAPDNTSDLPMLSPYNVGNASWASMTNTPMAPNFNTQQTATQADMVANATAMKLAALSTVNNRIALDDVRKYRRARSNEGENNTSQMPLSPGLPQNVLVVNEAGQVLNSQPLNPQQVAAIQAQQQAAFAQRSRPDSPGMAMHGGNFGNLNFASPQNNGYLAAYDPSAGLSGGMGALNLGQFSMGHNSHEGYLSDHSDMARGRSPRGRRGTSKPPEDPTDPSLLQDIPTWLRSLRLHKYTDNLKDYKWTELVELDDKGLEDRGVNALGARRKMLKVFEQVKEAKAEGKL
ncbi:Flap-structured DNA-binding and RNA-binding protein [Lepraria neglecta]|uniref:RNA-binding protein VTS1 n=1 Tax=Lepraria neglecta TaxID=209136 RepID=A0AAE0DPY3_9LECA|nr:Flap-structured DNA-binding and RNA-binding protein [Lepraria neglecta]